MVLLKTDGKNDQYFDRKTKSTYQFRSFLKLATRYTWSIVLGKVLREIKRKLIKAAPRFELGIKDLQSSALPLGHAAENEIFISNSNRISQAEQKLLFLCNGHGEDTIACQIMEALHKINPDVSQAVLPMVGEGKALKSS